MSIRTRELSQFGSYVFIVDDTQNIAITTNTTPFVGIGTTSPQNKLHVVGDVRIDGDLFYQGQLSFGDVDLFTSGIITARKFFKYFAPDVSEELVAFDSWESDEFSVYNRVRNIGVGITNPTEKIQVVGGNVSASRFISTVSTGTPPLLVESTTEVANLNASLLRGGVPGGTNFGDIVTIDAQQSLFNKQLESSSISPSGVRFTSFDSGSVILKSQSISTDQEVFLPSKNGVLVSTGDEGVVTGITIANETIRNSNIALNAGIAYEKLNLTNSITNSDIAPNAQISVTKLAQSTISNISLGSTLRTLIAGEYITYGREYTGPGYNGSTPLVISVRANTQSEGNSLVARDASGDFSAGTVTVTNLNVNQTLRANTFNITNLIAVNATVTGIITATQFRRVGGTADQFLKADGSVDSRSFTTASDVNSIIENITLATVTSRGNTTTTSIQASQFIRTGGTSSQFLKADGSVDSKVYLTAGDLPSFTETDTLNSVTSRGNSTTNSIRVGIITATEFRRVGGTSSQFLKADGSIDSNSYLNPSNLSSFLIAGTNITLSTNTSGQVTINSSGGGTGGGGSLLVSNVSTGFYYPTFVSATSGTVSIVNVSSSKLTFNASSGNLTVSSDRTKKKNIKTIENALEITKKLNGVKFDWIDTGLPSIGLIAQEVEEVLPEIVETDPNGNKSLSYGNIVSVLIEAIKELSEEVEDLKRNK